MYEDICNKKQNLYYDHINELEKRKKLFNESINNAIEYHLLNIYKPNKIKDKNMNKNKNKLESLVNAKKEEYYQ